MRHGFLLSGLGCQCGDLFTFFASGDSARLLGMSWVWGLGVLGDEGSRG